MRLLALIASFFLYSLAASAGGFPEPGKEFRDCAACPTMVVLPKSSFVMGSPRSERERLKHEGPQHRVRIAHTLAVAKHEVTFDEWDACVDGGGCEGFRPDDDGGGRGALPVIDVSWDNAQTYAAWLAVKTGRPYRLLSEAEWEYAARAGTKTVYWWGDEADRRFANYGSDTCCGAFASGRDQWELTAPVGSFPANAFGLHDMLGNVWEWVEDCWEENHWRAPLDGRVRRTGDCNRHVMRGGAWSSMPSHIRPAYRDAFPPDDRGQFIGFRVGLSE